MANSRNDDLEDLKDALAEGAWQGLTSGVIRFGIAIPIAIVFIYITDWLAPRIGIYGKASWWLLYGVLCFLVTTSYFLVAFNGRTNRRLHIIAISMSVCCTILLSYLIISFNEAAPASPKRSSQRSLDTQGGAEAVQKHIDEQRAKRK